MISECILEGEKVRLRPVRESDLSHFVEWLADREVTRWLAELEAPTLQEEQEWYERRRADPDSVTWAIETLEGKLAGSIELRVTRARRKAELGIGIFDKSQWNNGLGTDAVRLVVDYGFRDLALNRIELTTAGENRRAVRCYEKAGFILEGLKRQDRIVEGKFSDTLVMAVLREDWPP